MVPQSEAEFLAEVIKLARLRGWRLYHTRRSKGSDKGFYDLVLMRRGEMKLWELKTMKGKLSPEQMEWQKAGSEVRFLDVAVIRPDSPWQEVLK